jgi:sugar/nucleoside kinase (ribokinase family)
MAQNLKCFVITNGAEDILAYSDGSSFIKMPLSTFPVSAKVVESPDKKGDTTGCGDNFTGGLVASVAEQLQRDRQAQPDLREALSWAVASGGFGCFYVGGTWMETRPGEKREKVYVLQKAYLQQLERESTNTGTQSQKE